MWLFGVVGQNVPPLPKWSTRVLSVALLCPTTPQGERQEFANIQMDCQVPNSSALTCGNPAMQLRLASRNFSVQGQYRKYTLAAPARNSQLFSTRKLCLAAPARRSQLVSTSAVKEIHFGSSGSKVATFQQGDTLWQLGSKVATCQCKCSKGSTLWQLRLESHNFSAHV